MGADEASEYAEGTTLIQPGDTVMLVTDGLTELRGPDERELGERRLAHAVLKGFNERPGDLRAIKEEVDSLVTAHRDGAPLVDDVTFLLFDFA